MKELPRPLRQAIGYVIVTHSNSKMTEMRATCERCGTPFSGSVEALVDFEHEHVCDPGPLRKLIAAANAS